MESAQKNLIERFNQEFIAFSILFILMVIVLCFTVILYVKNYKNIRKGTKILVPILFVFFMCLTFILTFLEIRYIKDLEYVKKHQFYQIDGEAVGYSQIVSNGDDLTVTRSWPIIKDRTSNECVSLNVSNSDEKIEIGEYYTIIYLPNTKIAEIVE